MNRPKLLYRGPVETVSGYGAHSRDLLRSLRDLNMFDIMIDSCPWGHTPMTALDTKNEFHNWIKENIVVGQINVPEIYVQVTVPVEFTRVGKVNIGVTAGIESTVAPKDWIDGCNRMDLILTTSNFSKNVLMSTVYNETDKQTNQVVKIHKVEKPIEVLFEGVDTDVYNKGSHGTAINNYLDKIDSDFALLFVGHWLGGDIGHDRKDVGMLIKCFCNAFNNELKRPCLILKTSTANFSVKERERLKHTILGITKDFDNPPPIHLLFGDLSDKEMNDLYNHNKIKGMITLTKGEGFGRPLLEFSLVGKPVIASNWSGHTDFLSKDKSILLSGNLTTVHESSVNNYIVKDAKWFTADYVQVVNVMKYFYNNYEKFLDKAEDQRLVNMNNFSLTAMTKKLEEIIKKYLVIQKKEKINLPNLIEVD